MDDYRSLFPIAKQFAYLNHAAVGPLPTPTVEAVNRFCDEQATMASVISNEWTRRVGEVRRKMADFIGAAPEEIAITKNTPDGISIVAGGLDWREGDNVVLPHLEFPSNVYPWLNLRSKRVDVRFVQSQDGRMVPDDIFRAVDARTRVIAVSWVEFSNGFLNNLEAIGAFCRQRGIYLVVDAMQGLGALKLDVKATDVDFAAAASHKWLCAPTGVGWFYCRKELLGSLHLTVVGQCSVLPHTSYLEYNLRLRPNAERFEPGLVNLCGIMGLEASLDLFQRAGRENIERRVMHLTDLAVEKAQAKGYRLNTSRLPGEGSAIASFVSQQHSSEGLLQRLTDAGVVVSLREGAIRISPHFYNNEDDIERLADALP